MTAERGSARFSAPWSRSLVVMSGLFAMTVGIPAAVQLVSGRLIIGGVLLGVLLLPLALTVRGYEVVDHELRIRRLCWDTRWPLDGLTAATVAPRAMAASLRTWGIGGAFSFSGHFVNTLGRYRAFVTDPERTVVLHLSRGILVVSPDRPQEFVEAVVAAAPAGVRRG